MLTSVNLEKTAICSRCGKQVLYWHWVDGLPVCADDRLCVAGKYLTKRQKKLVELKHRYAGRD